MDDLLKTLPTILRAIGDEPEVVQAAAIAAWKRAAGDGLRAHAVPQKVSEGVLVVAVADAVWQKQLGAMKSQMIFRMNSILGQPLIKDVQLTIDPGLLKPLNADRPEQRIENEVPLELWSAANAIADKELRQKFIRAATSSIQRQENKQ